MLIEPATGIPVQLNPLHVVKVELDQFTEVDPAMPPISDWRQVFTKPRPNSGWRVTITLLAGTPVQLDYDEQTAAKTAFDDVCELIGQY